jgi:hypothetical protein
MIQSPRTRFESKPSPFTLRAGWTVAVVAAVLVGDARVRAQVNEPHAPVAAAANAPDIEPPSQGRLREGMQIVDRRGHFRMTGDRLTFFAADGKGRFVALENLALERVALVLAKNPGPLRWSVTGTITEFRDANYLLIERAILKTRTDDG